MRLMCRGIMQANACAHQRAKSCKATLCSGNVTEKSGIYENVFIDMTTLSGRNM